MEIEIAQKLWRFISLLVFLLFSIQFGLKGFYRERLLLQNKSVPTQNSHTNDKKVILLLVDALREDFVQFDEQSAVHTRLPPGTINGFTGQKIELFKELREQQPENSLLFSARSSMPTLTHIRAKSLLNGGIENVYSRTDKYTFPVEVIDDNLLYQVKQTHGASGKTILYGEHLWKPFYGQYFDQTFEHYGPMSDLDTLDNDVQSGVLNLLQSGSDFKLVLAHIIGIDSAAHLFEDFTHPEVRRKILDSEKIISSIIKELDEHTTLLVFGDHGMQSSGAHGGDDVEEIRTILFAYQKQPFAMHKNVQKYPEMFYDFDHNLKLTDISSIVALTLDLSFPFSNMGTFHPGLSHHSDLNKINTKYIENLVQIESYIIEYCSRNKQTWCDEKIQYFKKNIAQFKIFNNEVASDIQILERLVEMSKFANQEFVYFEQVWTYFDLPAFYIAISLQLYTILVTILQSLSPTIQSPLSSYNLLTASGISMFLYLVQHVRFIDDIIALAITLAISVFINLNLFKIPDLSFIKMSEIRNLFDVERITDIACFIMIVTIGIIFLIYSINIGFQESNTQIIETLLLVSLFVIWVTQPSNLRLKDVWAYLVIGIVVRTTALVDRDNSKHELMSLAILVRQDALFLNLAPLLLTIWVDHQINKTIGTNQFPSHTLTALVAIFFFFRHNIHLISQTSEDVLRYICCFIVFGTCICCFFYYKIIQKLSFPYYSILIGTHLSKAAMMIASGTSGPLLYTCLLIQLYSFSVISKHHSKDVLLLTPFKCFFVFQTGIQYFFRSTHRESVNSLGMFRVCPSSQCSGYFLWPLVYIEYSAPYLICLLLLPLTLGTKKQKQKSPTVTKTIKDEEETGLELTEIRSMPIQQKLDKPTEFKNQELLQASVLFELLSVIVLLMTTINVYQKTDSVFIDRVTPKFLFDASLSLTIAMFVFPWQFI